MRDRQAEQRLKRRFADRYGGGHPIPPVPHHVARAAATFDVLLGHQSVRRFTDRPLAPGTLEWLIAAAQSASTSSNLQTWSVVAITDPTHKQAISTLCADQAFIRQAPLFLIFIADLDRLASASAAVNSPAAGLEYLEMFVMATIDATLAAQNAVIAAEALGLGTCYVGAARNRPHDLARALELPARTIAVFGLAVGHPSPGAAAAIKPRLPQSEVLHRERYDARNRAAVLNAYDATMRTFYASQRMAIDNTWRQHSAQRVATVHALRGREFLGSILHAHGFPLLMQPAPEPSIPMPAIRTDPATPVVVRRYTNPAPDALVELYRHLHPLGEPTRVDEALRATWHDVRDSPTLLHLVADVNGVPTSTCSISFIANLTQGSRPLGVIRNIVTHPEFRRRGLASAVVQTACTHAWDHGCFAVVMVTDQVYPGGPAFCASLGFRPESATVFIATSP